MKLEEVLPAPGDWVAVLEKDHGRDVAAWAVTNDGVIGLVSEPNQASLALTATAIGYVQKQSLSEDPNHAAGRYFEKHFKEEPEEDEEDEEDEDPDDEEDEEDSDDD